MAGTSGLLGESRAGVSSFKRGFTFHFQWFGLRVGFDSREISHRVLVLSVQPKAFLI